VYPYNTEGQLKILSLVFKQQGFIDRYESFIKPAYFDSDDVRFLYRSVVLPLYSKGHKLSLLMAKEELIKLHEQRSLSKERLQILFRLLIAINKVTTEDEDYIIERLVEFGQIKVFEHAVEQASSFLDKNRLGDAKDILQEAFQFTPVDDDDIHYFDNIIPRIIEYEERRREKTVPTCILELDEALGGGLRPGELAMVIGSTGFGKSLLKQNFAAGAMLYGKTVFYFTHEMLDTDVDRRFHRSLGKVASEDILKKAERIENAARLYQDYGGDLWIKHFPSGFSTPQDLRAYIKRKSGQGIDCDIIFEDYAGLLRPTTGANDKKYERLANVMEELKGLAIEFKIPVWTSAQAHREAQGKKHVDLYNLADSYAQGYKVDIAIAICQTGDERKQDEFHLYIAKNREGRARFRIGPIGINYNFNLAYTFDPIELQKREKVEE